MKDVSRYVVLDLETTGLSAKNHKIIEIGAIRIVNHRVEESFCCFVNPRMPIPSRVVALTGITDDMVLKGKQEDAALEELLTFLGEDIVIGHNVNFDYSFVKQWAVNHKRRLEVKGLDTLKMARKILPPDQPKKLESLCAYFGITRENAHRALDDALETYEVFERLCVLYREKEMEIPDPVPLVYHAKRQTPATKHQVERLQQYMKEKKIGDTINWEVLTRGEASRIQDKYYEVYGR